MGFISFLKSLWKKEVELVEETISEELIQPTKVEEPAYYQSEDPELVKTFTVPTEGISRGEAENMSRLYHYADSGVLDTKIEESKSVEPEPVKEEPRQETAKEIKAKVTKSQVKKVAPSPKKPVAKKKPAPKKKP